MNLLNQMERKLQSIRLYPFYRYIVLTMAALYAADLLIPFISFRALFSFSAQKILHGEVWRMLAFLLLPPDLSIIGVAFFLYMDYHIGTLLETRWGVRRFALYYAVGALLTILFGFVFGHAVNDYLNLSLLITFSVGAAGQKMLLFFFLPVDPIWIAVFVGADMILSLFTVPIGSKGSIIAAFITLYLFLGGDILTQIRALVFQVKRRRAFRNAFKK